MRKLVAAFVLGGALACAAAAQAASPVLIGDGTRPGVTVDGSGTAYIAWIGTEPNTTSLHFCRLPRNATACAVTTTIAVPGTSLTRPYVLVDGSTVRVISYRYGLTGSRFDADYMMTSNDGGATFDGGVQIGINVFYDAIRGPGNAVALIADNSALFQRAPIDGSGPALTQANLTPDHPYTPSVALTGPNSLLAVFANGASAAQFRRFTGAGDPNDAASWTPAQDFADYAAYMRLAGGPNGTYLLSDASSRNIEVRKFAADGSGFAAPVPIPGPAHPLSGGSDDMAQDPSGRLHVVWPFGDAVGYHLGYATSDDGSSWQATKTDITQTPGQMRVGVAADHIGVAVFDSAAGSAQQVFAIPVGPSAGAARPVIGKTATAAPEKGTVLVKLPPGTTAKRARALGVQGAASGFVPLTAATTVPIGSTLDTTRGTVRLTTAAGTGKADQVGHFNGGQFLLQQTTKNPLVTLSMRGGNLSKCGTRVPSGGSPKRIADAASRKRKLTSNASGRYATRGRNSVATVRGTQWTMTDTCAGTLTSVKRGSVIVRDLTLRKNKRLKAGQRYLARPPRKK